MGEDVLLDKDIKYSICIVQIKFIVISLDIKLLKKIV